MITNDTNHLIYKQLQQELTEFNITIKCYWSEHSLYLSIENHPRYSQIRISDHSPKPKSDGSRFAYNTLYIDTNNFIFGMEIKNIRFKTFNEPILSLIKDYKRVPTSIVDLNALTKEYISCINNKIRHLQTPMQFPDTLIARQLENLEKLYEIRALTRP